MNEKQLEGGCCGWDTCLYCDMPLGSSHEHDHFPVPKGCGGKQKFAVCRNCHDLKDRDHSDLAAFSGIPGMWAKLSPIERIGLAKIIKMTWEVMAQSEATQEGAPGDAQRVPS